MQTPKICLYLLTVLSLLAGGPVVWAKDINYSNAYKDRNLQAVRIEGQIKVDGFLDEPEWQLPQPAGNFIQKLPQTGEQATEPTEVRILYDADNLYIGVHCFDSAGAEGIIINDITRDFYTLDSDGFQVILDTFDDDRNSFLFGTNPGAAKFDMQIEADGAKGNSDWDGAWDVATHIDDEGWHIEMAIPFKTLRFRGSEIQDWGVNFERRVRRKFEDSYWSPLPPPYRLGRISLGGALQGLRQLKQGRNFYLKPYVSTPIIRRENDDWDFQPDAGLDLKYGLSSQLTLDVTVNTDFSQVEADEEQINLTRFSLFFPEKRDFFLENAGVFEVGRRPRERGTAPDLLPFFSRRIGISDDGGLIPILGGARVTGRAGKYTLGLLSMQADDFRETPSTNFSVARVRRDILDQSEVGVILINKEQDGAHFNRTVGGDASLNFFDYLDVSTYLLKTETPGLEDQDEAGNFQVSWRDNFFDLSAGYLSIGENFNPEVGFVPRVGIRKTTTELGITPRPEERISWIREIAPSVRVDYITDPHSNLETRIVESEVNVIFSDSSFLSVVRAANFERLEEPFQIRSGQFIPIGDYDFGEYSALFRSDRSKLMYTEARVATGEFFNGDRNSYQLGLNFQPSFRFAAGVVWNHNDVELPTGDFKTNLVATRLNYSFSTQMFLNALIQYNSDDREISSNIRFNFIHKPLSDFFLVYNERRDTSGEVTERALIAKLTYIFSF